MLKHAVAILSAALLTILLGCGDEPKESQEASATPPTPIEQTGPAVNPPTPETEKQRPVEVELAAPTLDIWTAAAQDDIDEIAANLAAGIDINSRVPAGFDFEGATALHIAVLTKQVKSTKFLMEKGADLNAKAEDENGGTPLHWAAAFGLLDFVKILIESDADVNSPDKNGFTPMDAVFHDPTGGQLSRDPQVQADKFKIAEILGAKGGKAKADLD
jgi:hypothetical protein